MAPACPSSGDQLLDGLTDEVGDGTVRLVRLGLQLGERLRAQVHRDGVVTEPCRLLRRCLGRHVLPPSWVSYCEVASRRCSSVPRWSVHCRGDSTSTTTWPNSTRTTQGEKSSSRNTRNGSNPSRRMRVRSLLASAFLMVSFLTVTCRFSADSTAPQVSGSTPRSPARLRRAGCLRPGLPGW